MSDQPAVTLPRHRRPVLSRLGRAAAAFTAPETDPEVVAAGSPWLTEVEHRAVALTAELWELIGTHIIAAGPAGPRDIQQIHWHINAVQQAVLAQAAARSYPDRYRLLGALLPQDEAGPVFGGRPRQASRARDPDVLD